MSLTEYPCAPGTRGKHRIGSSLITNHPQKETTVLTSNTMGLFSLFLKFKHYVLLYLSSSILYHADNSYACCFSMLGVYSLSLLLVSHV